MEKQSISVTSVIKQKQNILLYFAWIFFVFMMLFNLTNSPLWGDELVEWSISQKSIFSGEMYHDVLDTFQPPLYNVIMHYWLYLGTDLLWFRLFNVIIGIVSGVSLYLTLSITTNKTIGAISLLALGATYQWIYLIQECSEYALMLMFLFLSIYFYVLCCKEKSIKREIGLIISCVLAMYSQYGAFFVVVPVLALHFINVIKQKEKKQILRTVVLYAIAFVMFALPLYFLFARYQMANQGILNEKDENFSWKFYDVFLVFGKLISYFFNLNSFPYFYLIEIFFTIFGLCIMAASIYLLAKKGLSFYKKTLIIVLGCAYIVFFLLVITQVYAMLYPGHSLGFYSRYAYFFIPLLFVVLPTVIYDFTANLNKKLFGKIIITAVSCVLSLTLLISYSSLLKNWKKSHDDELAAIWVMNAGFEETTYLIGGAARIGFEYSTEAYKYNLTGEILDADKIDLNKLPNKFWIWRFNWSGDMWQEIVNVAEKSGYKVVIYANYGARGQLAHCIKE